MGSKQLHTNFQSLPVSDTCTWPGTNWVGEGKNAKLLPCVEETVGAGLFCDPTHTLCEYHSVCKRHKKAIETW